MTELVDPDEHVRLGLYRATKHDLPALYALLRDEPVHTLATSVAAELLSDAEDDLVEREERATQLLTIFGDDEFFVTRVHELRLLDALSSPDAGVDAEVLSASTGWFEERLAERSLSPLVLQWLEANATRRRARAVAAERLRDRA